MVVHIVHRRTARSHGPGCSLAPDEEGLIGSEEIIPVEETIEAVHADEAAARTACAALNKTACEEQAKKWGEVGDEQTWTVTSTLVEKGAAQIDLGQIDWRECPQVQRNPKIMSGAWCFAGTRLPLSVLFGNLADGLSVQKFLEQYPAATDDQVNAVLQFQAERLEATSTTGAPSTD